MKNYLLIVLLGAAHGFVVGQSTVNSDSLGNKTSIAGGIAFNKLGVCTIYMTDGTLTKNCAITAIKPLYVVYQKNRTLHDVMKERIRCIVPVNEDFVLWFNEKKEAVISKECRIEDK